jgi:hypothetical protein
LSCAAAALANNNNTATATNVRFMFSPGKNRSDAITRCS